MAGVDCDYVNIRQNSTLDYDNLGVNANGDRTFTSGNRPNSIITQEGVTIVVKKGNICDEMVDGLANSVGGHFNLSEGAIAKSILQQAGPKIQEELTRVKPKNARFGDVVETKGYNLSASHVFHGVLKKWNKEQDDAEKVLRYFIRNVLMAAEKHGLKSLAFPAVGSGALAFPADVVATCLFEECDRLSERNSLRTLNEIRLVIYDKDTATFNAFETKLAQLLQSGASNDSPDPPFSDDFDHIDPASLLAMLIKGLQTACDQEKSTGNLRGIGVPNTWSDPDPCDPYRRIELDPSTSEYKSVVKNVQASDQGAVNNIIKVERIENPNLWKLYSLTKQNLEQVNGTQMVNERLLWHGTAVDALNNIYAGGFNRSYCGKNAVVYGQGVYFARDFCYSAQRTYSPPDPISGNRYIFQCRVLTGHFTVGKSDMIEPPMRTQKLRYDSVTDNVNDPDLWVVFKDTHAYPEYLVTFM